jgi:Transposase IS116/IS110/IS902 family
MLAAHPAERRARGPDAGRDLRSPAPAAPLTVAFRSPCYISPDYPPSPLPLSGLLGLAAQLAARAAGLTAAMPGAWGINPDGTTGPDAGTAPDAPVLNAVTRLAQIPGISPDLARAIIAETGLDMTRFPTAGHLVSWAGLCPSARQSGPRTRAGKKGQGNTWLRGSLGLAATGAARTATFLGERYHRIARRLRRRSTGLSGMGLSARELDCHTVIVRTSQVSGGFRLPASNRQAPVLTLPSGTQRARQGLPAGPADHLICRDLHAHLLPARFRR